jgi:hypothetical protein
MKEINIYYKESGAEAVILAAQEFKRYLEKMTGESLNVLPCGEFPANVKSSIMIVEPDNPEGLIKADQLDDEILVTQRDGNCIITGSNPRSVLFAAYAALEKLGARWIGPGESGEYIPKTDINNLFSLEIDERAYRRHRGICIEGAPSLEHALGVIDWMTKKRMNSFYLQFKTSIYFWQNWYHHDYNKGFMEPREIDKAASLELDDQVIREVKRRGLILHRVGHGWTSEALGYEGLGWYTSDQQIEPEKQRMIAEVNGKREFFGGIPINTELCYSNPEAFHAIVDEVALYARENPEVDCLHFWLSDAANNVCECPECRKISQSDHYVRLIKAVSAKLKEEDIPTRIVFLCYFNTLEAPIEEKLDSDVDNVIFMFAPISRCYQHVLNDENCMSNAQSGGWELNKIRPPRTNKEFVKILRKWQEKYKGDSFIFDYYLWRPHLDHLNPLGLARIVSRDIKDEKELDLGGLMSCQALRSFYPLGLVMNVMAETLWDRDMEFDDIVDRVLKVAFGNAADMVREYLEALEKALNPVNYEHVGILRSSHKDKISALINLMESWEDRINSLKNSSDNIYTYNLAHYHRFVTLKAKAMLSKLDGEENTAKSYLTEAAEHIKQNEDKLHPYMDAWLALRTLNL